jgi:hypothetical protein
VSDGDAFVNGFPDGFSTGTTTAKNQLDLSLTGLRKIVSQKIEVYWASQGSGTTAQRPVLSSDNIGASYFDITLGKIIYWDGTAWVDATGAPV